MVSRLHKIHRTPGPNLEYMGHDTWLNIKFAVLNATHAFLIPIKHYIHGETLFFRIVLNPLIFNLIINLRGGARTSGAITINF